MECICQVAVWWMELRLPLGSSMSFRCTAYQRGFTGSTEIIIQYEIHNSCTWIFIFYYILFLMHFWSLRQKALPFYLQLLYICSFCSEKLIQVQILSQTWLIFPKNRKVCFKNVYSLTINTPLEGFIWLQNEKAIRLHQTRFSLFLMLLITSIVFFLICLKENR